MLVFLALNQPQLGIRMRSLQGTSHPLQVRVQAVQEGGHRTALPWSRCCGYQVPVLSSPGLGTPMSDFRVLCPNFSSLGLIPYFVYRAAAVSIVPKLFFLLNCRGFELE